MLRISMWSSFLIDLSPEEAVKTFSSKGWYDSEISTEHAFQLLDRGDPSVVGKEFRNYAQTLGVNLPQGHLWLQSDIICSKQDETLEILKKNIDLFLELGVQSAVLHPGGNERLRDGCPKEKIFEMRVEALRRLTDYIKDTDMSLCLENIGEAPDVATLLSLLDAVGTSHLGICLDTGHLNLAAEKNQGEFIRRAGKNLKALHIADNDGSGDQHLIPYGRGRINWDEVTSALKDIGYSGLFNFEVPGENRCPLEVRLAKLDYLKTMTEIMLK